MPPRTLQPSAPFRRGTANTGPKSSPAGARATVRDDGDQQQQQQEPDRTAQGEGANQEAQPDGGINGEAPIVGEAAQDPLPIQLMPPPEEEGRKKKKPKKHPQDALKQLWKNYDPEYHGKITQILPDPVPTYTALPTQPKLSQNASESYKAARDRCERDVNLIITECRAINQKYTDVHFDLERDLKVTWQRNCIKGLVEDGTSYDPADVKRVTELYENPSFFRDGAGYDDVMQGGLGDCWMVSALSILGTNEELLKKVCVIQDAEVGVYGFVFFRDGEWHPTIIDDQLYLSSSAFQEGVNDMLSRFGKEEEQKYLELFQTGSKALYFARCRDDNETWVPLIEKAFAKAHGGYDALSGGQTGEAIEDFTGGVTTEIYTTNILSKEKFWTEELSKVGKDFLFDGTDAMFRGWRATLNAEWEDEWDAKIRQTRKMGIVGRHAYAVLNIYEGHGERLVQVRNPWGSTEWNGDWSDGSSKWTPEWLQRVGHTFGDDGVFWMSYRDFLVHFKHLDRTRLFDDSWFTAQRWASMQVPFNNLDYQTTKFTIDVPSETHVVIVLTQLDTRYFTGLEGKFDYSLQFRLSKFDDEEAYIARSRQNVELERSVNVELNLAQGKYTVLVKIHAQDLGRDSPEEVIKQNLPWRKEKVTTVGRLYDLAHQKGLPDPEEIEPKPEDQESRKGNDTPKNTEPEMNNREANFPPPIEAPGAEPRPIPVMIVAPPAEDSDSEDEDEDEKDPWNASCVVGLRVYSKLPDVSVGVVWPPKPKVEVKETESPILDRDAITIAPQEEAQKAVDDAEAAKDGKTEEKPSEDNPSEEGSTEVKTESTQTEVKTGDEKSVEEIVSVDQSTENKSAEHKPTEEAPVMQESSENSKPLELTPPEENATNDTKKQEVSADAAPVNSA